MTLNGGADAMSDVTPIRKPLHLFAPVFDSLLQGLGRATFVKDSADAGFRCVSTDTRHDAGNLSWRNRGKDDDVERIPRHACLFNHPCRLTSGAGTAG